MKSGSGIENCMNLAILLSLIKVLVEVLQKKVKF